MRAAKKDGPGKESLRRQAPSSTLRAGLRPRAEPPRGRSSSPQLPQGWSRDPLRGERTTPQHTGTFRSGPPAGHVARTTRH